jgi:NADH-quinone oxidoreductase subunit N
MIDFNLIPILPELFLAVAGMVLLMIGAFKGNGATRLVFNLAIASFVIAGFLLFWFSWDNTVVLSGMFRLDNFAGSVKILILLGLVLSMALAPRSAEKDSIARFEYPVLALFAGIGMMLMVSANNFLSLYMALELQSLSLYVLAAFHRNSKRSAEAGVKYFTLGALSSGFLLFGISLIYGFTGALDFGAVTATLSTLPAIPVGVIFGLVFILAGLAFKISAVPFHMWTPDVYEGAPTPVTAFFAIVPKLAAIALIIRVLDGPFGALEEQWQQVVWAISLLSMIVGAFAALVQNNIKRLLAYSSIGNMGYALIGVAAGSSQGVAAVLLYMAIYMVTTAGLFAFVLFMRRYETPVEKISDLAGLSKSHPAIAYAVAILLFSVSGIPPMAGFFGKLVIFQAAVAQGLYVLAVLGILTSVVAAYYYLLLVKIMFFDETHETLDKFISMPQRAVLFFSAAFVIVFILKPSFLMGVAKLAALSILPG